MSRLAYQLRKLKPQWDEEMKKFLFEDPPGGTWEDRCIRRFGSSQYPKDEGQKCMAKRVSEGTGLSAGCGLCWGKLAECTYDNCAWPMIQLDVKGDGTTCSREWRLRDNGDDEATTRG